MGSAVDPTGLSFTVTKKDGTTASVSPQTLTPSTWGDTAGTQTCTFTYTDGYDSVSCAVEAQVEYAEVDQVIVTGTPVRQHAFTQVDPTGLTVTAHYQDGKTVDVTEDPLMTFSASQTDNSYWDNCLVYDTNEQTWKLDTDSYTVDATYEETGSSSSFKLYGQYEPGESIEIPNGADSFATLNLIESYGQPLVPWDGATGGYLVEGANIGDNVWIGFTKSQFDNDTPIDLQAFGGMAQTIGAKLAEDANGPGFGVYSNVTYRYVLCVAVDGTGTTDSEYVFVAGKLNHAVTAGGTGTIQKSYFDYTGENACATFPVKLISGS